MDATAAVMRASPTLEDAGVVAREGHPLVNPTAARNGIEATLATEDGGAARLESMDGRTPALELDLVGSDEFIGAAIDGDYGVVSYEHPDGFSYVPVLREDATVQAHTVIEEADAPTEFTYDISVPTGGELVISGDSVLILDADEQMVGGVAPAWAKDADGRDVATHYEVDGNQLTQVVEHRGAAYPVVADPWLGKNLFGHVYTDWTHGAMRVNANPSAWGKLVWAGVGVPGGPAGGQAVLNTYGWLEVWSRGADVRRALNKDSMRQQFECHALGSPFAGEWNLEKWRPNRTVHWSYGVAIHRCNWKTANRY
ncbi:DUF2599 domain-containing protein [Micrococcus sp. HMSC067E09]|uniref:DUF2599 domain-containing protein n=2 Tax=Micrococcus TaxID=1269 RepID=UPI00114D2233|nr:DUF2599 domain-containing protein [Micrococcus sp. HMSC067E09]